MDLWMLQSNLSNEKALIYILKTELEKKANKLKHMKLNVNAVKTMNKILSL